MRLLHVVPTYLPALRYGGPIVSVHGLCKALAGAGHEVHVFTTNVDGPGESPVPLEAPVMLDGVSVRYFPVPFARRLYRSAALGRALEAEIARFDAVHVHSVFLWPTWAAARAARRAGVPYVLSPRGMLVPELIRRRSRWAKTAWIALIERRNIEYAHAVHVTSAREAEDFASFGFRMNGKLVIVPNGVELPAAPPASPAAGGGQRFILFLGRISWKKGLDRLIAAMENVRDVRLVIAGSDDEGYAAEVSRMAARAGIQRRVEMIGPVSGDGKWQLFRDALCFVLPSYSENFGNAALEAMAAGCPVVVTPEVGIAEVVERSGAGVVSDGDPAALAETLNALLADEAGRARMSRAGPRAAAEEFAWPAVASEMTALYRSYSAAAK